MRAVWTFALMTMRSLLRCRTIWGIVLVIILALLGIGQVPSFDVSGQSRFIV